MGGCVIVTGAASGLGRSVAQQLAAGGRSVALVDFDGDAACETARSIEGPGAAAPFAADVRDWSSVERAVQQVTAELGAPTALVNAAAVQRFAHAHELDPLEWHRIISTNLTGTYFLCRAVLPHLMTAGGGAIVNIASTAGLAGLPYDVAYCASKGGVVQLTKALAIEYASHGIRVNAVAPGGMQTPMLRVPFPDDADPRLRQRVRGSLLGVAPPEDVANVVLFLLSEHARYMTGSIVVADGGALA
ncbi:MAG TPA: SDR family oxidoreductase [Acidimicrobiales bacterium]|jgi:NAD(P)-dependent dehydrogenase (short-subunit alcohol dehydrogenase family)|nr:SDR family oxidoreductase [Acidimicrobiales bacterium]